MAEDTKPVTVPGMSSEEMSASFAGPAYLVNKIYLTRTPAGVRLAFMEQAADQLPSFRTAVLLSYQDALALRNLISRQLKEIEDVLKSAPPPGQPKG
jgi:hypothetical protein